MAIFIEEISSKAQEIFVLYAPLLKELDSSPKNKLPETQTKILDRNFCHFLTLISGLLLSIEQFTYNKTNPQVSFTTSSFVLLNVEESHYSKDGQKPLENSKFISEEALTNIIKWIDLLHLDSTPISIKLHIYCFFNYFLIKFYFSNNFHSRSTLIQIAFLITDLERGMILLKSSGIIINLVKFFKKYAVLHEEEEKKEADESKLTFVEETLTLNIVLKMLLSDNKLLGDFISVGGIELFMQIYELGDIKKYLDEVILNTFSYALKDIQYCDIVEEALKKVFIKKKVCYFKRKIESLC